MNTTLNLNFVSLWLVAHLNCKISKIRKSIYVTHVRIVQIIKYPMLKTSQGRFQFFYTVEFSADMLYFRQNKFIYMCYPLKISSTLFLIHMEKLNRRNLTIQSVGCFSAQINYFSQNKGICTND
jgi:hypothetical protein